jgi:tetratricopeptide (TPR) repeat protein
VTKYSDPVGFPIHALTDGVPQADRAVHPGVHERVRTHLLGLRTEDGIWPGHSTVKSAVDAYRRAHTFLYESVDPVAAAREYEAAAAIDPGYLQAWVGLALAWTSMGTPDSLESAVELWRALVDMPVGDDGVSPRCMSILLQNLAYTHYQQFLYSGEIRTLTESSECYLRANKMDPEIRPELYYPWCNVLLLLGQDDTAVKLWTDAELGTPGPVKDVYLDKYTGLSAFDLRWGK